MKMSHLPPTKQICVGKSSQDAYGIIHKARHSNHNLFSLNYKYVQRDTHRFLCLSIALAYVYEHT